MDWKMHFTETILQRGRDYYDSNAVRIYDYSGEHVDAQVAGSIVYDVRINFEGSEITSMYCNCPYDGNCKHLAATLYHIDDHPELLKKDDFTDLLAGLSYGDLLEFMAQELQKDPRLANRLKLFMNDADEDYYVGRFESSLSDSLSILRCIDEDFQDLINHGHYDLLFKLCQMLIDHINRQLEYGYFDMLEEIIYKIDGITTQLRDVDEAHEGICDFLEHAISTSDDYFILEELTDSMSRNGDMSRLYDD